MNEAGRCDRISLMHSGRSLVCDTPANIVAQRNAATLEEAFIGCLEDADPESNKAASESCIQNEAPAEEEAPKKGGFLGWLTSTFSFQRCDISMMKPTTMPRVNPFLTTSAALNLPDIHLTVNIDFSSSFIGSRNCFSKALCVSITLCFE